MQTFIKAAAAAVLVAVFAAAALAQSAAPSAADAVKARQANYKQIIGASFKAISDQLKSDKPDLAVIKPAAAKLKGGAVALPTWFPAGSGPESGVKTAAKPEIWSDAAGFATAAKTFADAAARLDQLAQAGDVAGLKDQVKAVGMACGACHTKYKVKDQH